MHSSGGKGSRQRPSSVDYKTFGNSFDNIFRREADPKVHCQVHKTESCANVSGPLCDFNNCEIRIKAIEDAR
jgi:hypothetical protein